MHLAQTHEKGFESYVETILAVTIFDALTDPMIFTDDAVDIPERLINSLTKDRLVVFVGAGYLCEPPKNSEPEHITLDFVIWRS